MVSPLHIAKRSARACRAADNLDAHRLAQMISIRISRMTGNASQLVVDANEVPLERQAQARASIIDRLRKFLLLTFAFAAGVWGALNHVEVGFCSTTRDQYSPSADDISRRTAKRGV